MNFMLEPYQHATAGNAEGAARADINKNRSIT